MISRYLVLASVVGSAFAMTDPSFAAMQRRGFGPPGRGFGQPTGPRIEPEKLDFELGVARVETREMFERLSYKGPDVARDAYLANLEFVKFVITDAFEENADVYFMNTQNHRAHPPWMGRVGISSRVRGAITYLPRIEAPDGTAGLYIMDYQPNDSYSFEQIRFLHELLVREMPILKGKFSFHPLQGNLRQYESEKQKYADAGIPVHLDEHLFQRIAFLPLNAAVSFGTLRVMENDVRPSPRDIVICQTLPNQMPRVAGVITEVRQTPLSHVNLRAVQDKVPNSWIRDALKDKQIESLLGRLVRYEVSEYGYKLREASADEVEKHFAELRPATPQKPKRDLSARDIRGLQDVGFKDSAVFGVKAANLAQMHQFGFPDGTVPNGHAIPFSWYDEFMEHNGFYERVRTLLADPEFQSNRDRQVEELSALRQDIEKAEMPEWMLEALGELHASYPAGTSLRCRSSTNNEDLPGFSGAGLYDSFTHKPSEGHLSKSIRQVYASLWNFRAFEERDFYRVDHLATAMGVLVHPNYKGERANGVAVTDDILYESQGNYYINTQVGEDLVTNPHAASSPEETLLGWYERDGHQIVRRSAQARDGKPLLTDKHLELLRAQLATIHARFAELYGRDREELTFAMEIEFKITKDDRLVIKQARPWVFHQTERN